MTFQELQKSYPIAADNYAHQLAENENEQYEYETKEAREEYYDILYMNWCHRDFELGESAFYSIPEYCYGPTEEEAKAAFPEYFL